MSDQDSKLPRRADRGELDAFLRRAELAPGTVSGRLLFAMDATASREPTWDMACEIQGEMFSAGAGGLEVQLCHYGGPGFFHTTPWVRNSHELLRHMSAVRCLAGGTQIAAVLRHACAETRRARIDAAVFVGDCMEENQRKLVDLAAQLGMRGTPLFIFHEGFEPTAAAAFKEMARVSRGAYCRFDARSAAQLKELLGAVAAYAAGGHDALLTFSRASGAEVRRLTRQLEER